MNCKGCGRKRSWPNLKYYPDIFLEGLNKTRISCQASRYAAQDLNRGPAEYEASVTTTGLRRSFVMHVHMTATVISVLVVEQFRRQVQSQGVT
jgi:hypothetical protein